MSRYPMIIDAHYHLDERMEPIDRLLSAMDRSSIARVALIPTMVDVLSVDSPGARALLALARRGLMGPGRSAARLVYRSSVSRGGKLRMVGRSYEIYARPDNDAVLRALESHPDRFYGWIFVNPAVDDPIEELHRRAGERGWVGVKAHPYWHRYPVRLLDDVAAYCSAAGMPLLLHLGGDSQSGDFRFLPERHPALRVIYAHAGVPFFRELWEDVRQRSNVYVDLSGVYLDEPMRAEAVKALGPERCLYGSDGPYGYPDERGHYDHAAIVRELERLPVTSAERDRILGETFLSLLPG